MIVTNETWLMDYIQDSDDCTQEMDFEVKQGKYKFIGDTCEMYVPRFQKKKKSNKGNYLLIMGKRFYFGFQTK